MEKCGNLPIQGLLLFCFFIKSSIYYIIATFAMYVTTIASQYDCAYSKVCKMYVANRKT